MPARGAPSPQRPAKGQQHQYWMPGDRRPTCPMTRHRITAPVVTGTLKDMAAAGRAMVALACAVAAFARAGPAHSQSGDALRIENEYRECLYSKSRSGRYGHNNDRESDFALLGECRKEWVAYMDLCSKQGFDNRTCVMKSRLVIHAILDVTGK